MSFVNFVTTPVDKAPAFPTEDGYNGLTKREYAAIKLRVPASGTEWLDDMIRQSLRDEFAAKAMQGWVAVDTMRFDEANVKEAAQFAYEMADAMLEAGSKS